MAPILPLPPYGTPFIDQNGQVSEAWRRYLLSLENALVIDVAPKDAQYWVSTSNSELTNERNIGALASGYLLITTALGIATPSTTTTIPVADITGTLPVTKGGTGAASFTANGVLYGNATAALQVTAQGVANSVLIANAGAPAFSATPTVTSLTATTGVVTAALQADSITNDTGLAAGTYTPTLTNAANITASTAYESSYLRVGNTVTVSGKVDIDPTSASTLTVLGISLPIASNFDAEEQGCGTAVCGVIPTYAAAILANAADRVDLVFTTDADVANRTWAFHFTYRVIV